ncbi:1-phosphofructokinase [Sutcliffiella horikoshii]|uniref:Tagatose-6-phosphate kinase n=1 Tax=Sutcliffiella horikoshii TaxID=79883 RepID=A0A1Y0CK81_9BACI|nr:MULTISPECIES: 1-phosphofructokinase [Bacillaceae]ART75582.1 1-phosphofructokinase [Sutcliffiella horikoshii]TYS73888.1 1-phosphofructokinase [Sutcliffiella horikoshii]
MIYTITLNPSIDYVMEVESFQEGTVNRASETRYYPGGKGINVSRVLKRLGADTIALGYAAGFTGNFIKEKLIEEQVAVRLLEVDGHSRINVKLKAVKETEINGTGPLVDDDAVKRLLQQLNHLTSEDIVVLAGSVPGTVPSNIYETLILKCQEHDAKVVLDTGGSTLKALLSYKPFFIKPNHHELGDLFSINIQSIDDVIHYAGKIHEQGVQNVVVSMAGEGAILYTESGVYFAKAPKGEVRNSVGAGDSLVAGFLAGFVNSNNIEEALRYGIASGSATAFSYDLCQKVDVNHLLEQVHLEKL